MKKGFTLVELLVVIAIIGILSIIVIPSIININSSINERMLATKKEDISSGAELYANNNEEIFNGTNEAYVYVWELIDANYVTVDSKFNVDNCKNETEVGTTKGCVINPVTKMPMNKDYVIITREGAGVSTEYVSTGEDGTSSSAGSGKTLVVAVCDILGKDNKANGQAYKNGEKVACKCGGGTDSYGNPAKIVDAEGHALEVDACLFAGTDVNNHLRYGNANSNKPNWRVLGVYMVDGHLTPKMITSGAI